MNTDPLEILILTTAACAWCDQAKEVAERLSGRWPLVVSTIDLDSPEGRHLVSETGAAFPPVIFVDGEFLCYGRPSERRLRRELERRFRPDPRSGRTA